MIFNTVREAGGGWDVHRELTVAGLHGIPVPQAAMGDWYRMCDELVEQDIMTDTGADLNLSSEAQSQRTAAVVGRRESGSAGPKALSRRNSRSRGPA
jgi:hypothetical protein